jgi:dolichol-phosphate mannosyltransferase
VGVASYLFSLDTGWVWSAVAGIAVGAVWNFAMTTVYTWKVTRR